MNSKEERNNFKNAVNGRHVILIWLTSSLSPMFTSAIQTKFRFQEATEMSKSVSLFYQSKANRRRCRLFPSMGLKSILNVNQLI